MKAAVPLLLILLLALALRVAPLGHNRFLEDEALYAYWGLQIATGVDPMLDEEPVDKPPAYPYLVALSYWVTGELKRWDAAGRFSPAGLEAQARLPSLMASVVSVALVYRLGRVLYGDSTMGLVAALLVAASPFDISFASTAFTDPLMVTFVLAALVAAGTGHPGAAGLLAGLAAATKQQGLFFLPLVAAIGLLPRWRFSRRGWVRLVLGFVAVAAGVTAWDLSRVQRPGFFEQSLIAYGGLGPAQPIRLSERAAAWARQLELLWGPFFLPGVGITFVLWLVARWDAVRRRWLDRSRRRDRWPERLDGVLAGFVALFLLAHWLLGFQVWDRYLLGLVPILALLAAPFFSAWGLPVAKGFWHTRYVLKMTLLGALCIGLFTLIAARGAWPAGGDHGAYDGIDQVTAYMHTEAPPGSVLYHYWLGHHYRFYLHGAPLRLHWYPDPADLVHDATVYRREPRYIAFPSFRDGTAARAALEEAGIGLVPVLETTRRDGSVSFVLYRMAGPDVGTLERWNVETWKRSNVETLSVNLPVRVPVTRNSGL
ncbi:MAG: glycosyltransferase family 39 protein [Anaerolineae bacterium]|nr:glycosyltransferase family 39 protein [Anaerolineae bacterium]